MSLHPSTSSHASRRRVVAAAVWTAPVIAAMSAAPALAASPCDTSTQVTLDWASTNYGRNINTTAAATGQASVTPSGQTLLVINFSEATTGNYHFGGQSSGGTANLSNSGVFGTSTSRGLDLIQFKFNAFPADPPSQLTITFSRPVTDLTFAVKDITNPPGTSSYKDTISFTPAPTSFTGRGSNLQGTGAVGDPFTTTGTFTVPGVDSPLSQVTPTFAGPLLTLVVNYSDTSPVAFHADQAMRLGNFTFSAKPDGCP